MQKHRCLFISHVPFHSSGGAGSSLRNFLFNQDFLEVDLLLPLFIGHLSQWPETIAKARSLKPSSVRRVFFLPLPFSMCFIGKQSSHRATLSYFINNIIVLFFLPLINRIINSEKYEFVYLNSIVLHQLISSTKKSAIHIRELLDRNFSGLEKFSANIRKAAGLIFIDNSTSQSFENHFRKNLLPCHRVVNNPFDMSDVWQLKDCRLQIMRDFGVTGIPDRIFSFLGDIKPEKGVEHIIKAFKRSNSANAVLLIVGAGNPNFLRYCKSLAGNNNIIFTGMLDFNEVKKIYAISDFIVRGDRYFRMGRTIYEGLYAGAGVIIPGSDEDLKKEPDLLPFKPGIFFYDARDIDSLAAAIDKAEQATLDIAPAKHETGNVDQHCASMYEFFQTCIFSSKNQ